MKRITSLFISTLLLGSGCSDGKNAASSEQAGLDPADTPIESIENIGGEVTLSLTRDYVTISLSEETLREISHDLDEAREDASGSRIASQVTNTILDHVEHLLNRQLKHPIENIDRITWDDGEMVFTLNSGDEAWDMIWIGEDSVLKTFDEDDALEFIEAFEELRNSGE